MEKIKVFIVEDDKEYISSIRYFIRCRKDITIDAVAVSKEEAVERALIETFDIMIINMNLCDEIYDGAYQVWEILKRIKTKIIMIIPIDDDALMFECLKAGAIECVKASELKILPDIIRLVYNRKTPLEILFNKYICLIEENILKDLTPSEKELFNYRKQGFSIKCISEKLQKTERTLKNQSGRIFKKLGVNNFNEALSKINQIALK